MFRSSSSVLLWVTALLWLSCCGGVSAVSPEASSLSSSSAARPALSSTSAYAPPALSSSSPYIPMASSSVAPPPPLTNSTSQMNQSGPTYPAGSASLALQVTFAPSVWPPMNSTSAPNATSSTIPSFSAAASAVVSAIAANLAVEFNSTTGGAPASVYAPYLAVSYIGSVASTLNGSTYPVSVVLMGSVASATPSMSSAISLISAFASALVSGSAFSPNPAVMFPAGASPVLNSIGNGNSSSGSSPSMASTRVNFTADQCRSAFNSVVAPLCGLQPSNFTSTSPYCSLTCAAVYSNWSSICVYPLSPLYPTAQAWAAFNSSAAYSSVLAFNNSCAWCAPSLYTQLYPTCGVQQPAVVPMLSTMALTGVVGAQDLLQTLVWPSTCSANCSAAWPQLYNFYSTCIAPYPIVPIAASAFLTSCSPITAPLPLSSLSFFPLSASSLSISWAEPLSMHAAPDAPTFTLMRVGPITGPGGPTSAYPNTSINVGNSTQYVDTGLQASSAYAYSILSMDSAGSSGWSAPFPVNTPGAPPSAPASASASVLSATSATVSWAIVSPTDASGLYYVVSRQAAGSAFPLTPVYKGNATSYTFYDLTYNTNYLIAVVAVSPSAGAGAAISINFTTPSAAPSAPISLSSLNVTVSSFIVQWAAPLTFGASSISYYQVQQQMQGGVWGPPMQTTQPMLSSADIAPSLTVQPLTFYTFRVNATNSGGRSGPYSSPFTLRTPANAPTMQRPVQATLSLTMGSSVQLSWNLSTDVNNGGSPLLLLHLSISGTSNNGSDAREVDVAAASSSYVLSSALYNASYTVTWRALNAYGWSASSAPTTFFTKTAAPSIISLRAGDSCACRTSFGVQSTLTVAFSRATSTPAISTQAGVDALFTFSPRLPGTYSGAWSADGAQAIITILSLPAQATYSIGLVTCMVVSNLTDAASMSASGLGQVSPPLSGTWYGASRNVSYFNPTQPTMSVREDSSANPIALAQAAGLYNSSTAVLSYAVLSGSLALSSTAAAASYRASQGLSANSTQLAIAVPYPNLRAFLQASLITYTPTPGSTATDVLTVSVQDQLTNGYASDSTTIPILISQVNHAPAVALPPASSIPSFIFGSNYTLPSFRIADADQSSAPAALVTVTVRVQPSTTALLTLSAGVAAPSTVSASVQAGVAVPTLTFAGPIADLNSYFALSPISFADTGMTASTSVASALIYVNDNGNGGSPPMDASASLTIPVTCQGTSAPQLLSATFNNDLGGLLLTFDSQLDQGAALTGDCGSFFANATAATFGLAPSCVFRGSFGVAVLLGYGATILPGAQLQLTSTSALRRCLGGQTTSGTITVSSPAIAIVPMVSILGPSIISSCDPLTLYGQATGLGGRPGAAVYSWSVSMGSTSSASSAVDATSTILGSSGSSSTLSVTSAQLYTSQAYYFFYLTVSNFLGQSSTAVQMVYKSQYALPLLTPQGGTAVSYHSADSFYISVTPVLSSCLTGSARVMNFSWAISPMPSTASAIWLSNPQINVPSYALPSGQYRFTLTGFMASNAALSSSVAVSVSIAASPIAVSITGGSVQQFSQLYNFSLQALASDPDQQTQLPSAFAWQWSCLTTAGLACFDNLAGAVLRLPNSAVQSVAAGQLTAGTYVFTTIGSNSGRSATASVTVSVVANPIPSISIKSYLTIVNPNGALFYSAAVSDVTGTPLRFAWSQVSGPTLSLPLISASQSSPQLVLNNAGAAVFTSGASYTFQCQVTNGFNQSNYAQVSVTINAPPYGGTLMASPASGYAFNTSFSLSAVGWQSSTGAALVYQFFAVSADGSLTQLSGATGQAVTSTQLAQGASSAVTVVVVVTDALGATTVSSTSVMVAPPPSLASDTTGATFSNILASATTSAAQTSNVGQLFTTLNSLSDSIYLALLQAEMAAANASSSHSRRRLLGVSTIPVNTLAAINTAAQMQVAANIGQVDLATAANAALKQSANPAVVTLATVEGSGSTILSSLSASSHLIATNSDQGRQRLLSAFTSIVSLALSQMAVLRNALASSSSSSSPSRRLLSTSSDVQANTMAQLANISSQCDSLSTSGSLAVAGQVVTVSQQSTIVQVVRNNVADAFTLTLTSSDNSTVVFPASSLANASSAGGVSVSALVDSRYFLFPASAAANPFVWAMPAISPITSVIYIARVNSTASPLMLPSSPAIVTAIITLPYSLTSCPSGSCVPRCMQFDPTQSMWTNASLSTSAPYTSSMGQLVVDCLVSNSLQLYVAAFAVNSSSAAQWSSSHVWSLRSSSSSAAAPALSSATSTLSSASGSSAAALSSSSSPLPMSLLSSSSSGSSLPFPAGSLSVTFYIVLAANASVTPAFLTNLTSDIAFNLATLLNVSYSTLLPYVVLTTFNGSTLVSSHSRRLLQAHTPVTFVLLGSIQQSALDIDPSSAVQSFSQAAAEGELLTPSSGASIPRQTVAIASANPIESSSSGLGSPMPSSSSSSNLPLALGVGLGVGIPLLVALAALFYHFCVKSSAPVASTAMLHQRLPAGSTSQ